MRNAFVLFLAMAAWNSAPLQLMAAQETFTIAVITDTQLDVLSNDMMKGFHAQVHWIRDHRKDRNIKFVTHVGDIVTSGKHSEQHSYAFEGSPDNINEWRRAKSALKVLDEINIPWGIVAGNHDMDEVGKVDSDYTAYREHFGPKTAKRFIGKPWFGGYSENELNTWQTFSAGGREFLFLHLELDVPDDAIQWAQSVIDANPGKPTLITTHSHLGPLGTPYLKGSGRNSRDEVFDKLIKNNPQVFMVLNGHHGVEQHRVRKNAKGLEVFECVQDYAPRVADRRTKPWSLGDCGWFRVFEFDEDAGVIRAITVNAVTDDIETDADSAFEFRVNFDARFGPRAVTGEAKSADGQTKD